MVPRFSAGKIVWLLEIIEKHPLEIVRDFREKFHLSVNDIGVSVRYDEAGVLVMSLLKDPESWLHATIANWEYPVTREWVLFADLWDLQAQSKSKKRIKPYPRPFSDTKRYGGRAKNGKVRSRQEIEQLLRPKKNLPNEA